MRLAIWCASSFNNRCPVLCIAVRCQKVQRESGGGIWRNSCLEFCFYHEFLIFQLISCSLPSSVSYNPHFFFVLLFICVLPSPFFPDLLLSCLPVLFVSLLPELMRCLVEEYIHTLLCLLQLSVLHMANGDPCFVGADKVQRSQTQLKYKEHGSSCHSQINCI